MWSLSLEDFTGSRERRVSCAKNEELLEATTGEVTSTRTVDRTALRVLEIGVD